MNRSFLAICAAFFFAICALWSFVYGVANLNAKLSRNQILLWEKKGFVDSETSWEEARDRMLLASSLSPFDADYSFDMGTIYEWGALKHSIWTKEARVRRGLAIEWYRKAISGRPSFGIAWASLAHSKALNQEMDVEVFEALERAMMYGSWEPAVQRKVIWIGLSLWDQLPGNVASQLTASLVRALSNERQAKFVIAAAVQLDKADVLLPLIKEKWHIDLLEQETKKKKEIKSDA